LRPHYRRRRKSLTTLTTIVNYVIFFVTAPPNKKLDRGFLTLSNICEFTLYVGYCKVLHMGRLWPYSQRLKIHAKDSNIFIQRVSGEEKKFYNIDFCLNVIKLFFYQHCHEGQLGSSEPFNASLILVNKVRSLPFRWGIVTSSTRVGSALNKS
jgi:hypothetical protein